MNERHRREPDYYLPGTAKNYYNQKTREMKQSEKESQTNSK